MVERFEPKLIGSITFLPDADGEWVKVSDYDALAAELAELQRKLERYEAIKRADIETLHEFADHLAYKRALEEG